RVGNQRKEAAAVGRARRGRREVVIGDGGDFVFHQLGSDQKISVVAALIESLNGQQVVPGQQRVQVIARVDVFKCQGLVIWMRRRGGGIPLRRCRGVAARDFLSVQVGDETV